MAFSTVILLLVSTAFLNDVSSIDYVIVIIIGFTTHYFGFITNDIMDFEFDRKAKSRSTSPFISSRITRSEMKISAIVFLSLTILLYLTIGASQNSMLLLIISCCLSLVYNFYSKTSSLSKYIPEMSLALSISILVLSVVSINDPYGYISALPWATLIMLILFSLNSISNGLKDLKTDSNNGAITFVIQNKCKYISYNQIKISQRVKIIAASTQVLILGLIVVILYLENYPDYLVVLPIVLASLGFWHMTKLLNITDYTVFHASKPFLYGYLNFASAILLLYFRVEPFVKSIIIILVIYASVFPFFHFINKLIYYDRQS